LGVLVLIALTKHANLDNQIQKKLNIRGTAMHADKQMTDNNEFKPDEMPFVAPCKQLDVRAPLRWLKLGWQDIKRAPRLSLSYGFAMLVLGYLISGLAYRYGNLYTVLGLMSGFILVGPFIAIGLYSISCQLQEGRKPVLGYCLREGGKHVSNIILYGFILMVVFLIWARAASMLNVFYPVDVDASWDSFVLYLSIGSVVGLLFSTIIFCASAFSLPMIMDRKVDMITAVVTSVNAVLRNKKVMFIWALIIAVFVLVSFATAFLGFIVLLPMIGHAVWHAYQETIDPGQWPRHD
jgi:uncharacterized membrane protein